MTTLPSVTRGLFSCVLLSIRMFTACIIYYYQCILPAMQSYAAHHRWVARVTAELEFLETLADSLDPSFPSALSHRQPFSFADDPLFEWPFYGDSAACDHEYYIGTGLRRYMNDLDVMQSEIDHEEPWELFYVPAAT